LLLAADELISAWDTSENTLQTLPAHRFQQMHNQKVSCSMWIRNLDCW